MIAQTQIQMVDLHGQYLKIKDEIDAGIAQVINSCSFVGGAAVNNFCRSLEEYLGAKHVIGCANGTDALHIALMALDLQPGDEVITASHTFVATAEAIALLGLKPVFADVDPDTFTLNLHAVEQAITAKTRCIIPVHLYGQSAHMEPLLQLAARHNLFVVEDNAQAIGATYHFTNGKTQKTGTLGHIGCTSFYPSKNLGCYGDGGAVFTNHSELAEKLRLLANHGQRTKYDSAVVGVNSRLDAIQAAVLNVKLKHLDTYNQNRQQAAAFYDRVFASHPLLTIPRRAPYTTHVFHQYTLKVACNRDALKTALQERGIPTMIYYPIPVHLQQAYLPYGYNKGSLPVTEQLSEQVISLPIHTEMDEQQLQYIAQTVLQLAEQV